MLPNQYPKEQSSHTPELGNLVRNVTANLSQAEFELSHGIDRRSLLKSALFGLGVCSVVGSGKFVYEEKKWIDQRNTQLSGDNELITGKLPPLDRKDELQFIDFPHSNAISIIGGMASCFTSAVFGTAVLFDLLDPPKRQIGTEKYNVLKALCSVRPKIVEFIPKGCPTGILEVKHDGQFIIHGVSELGDPESMLSQQVINRNLNPVNNSKPQASRIDKLGSCALVKLDQDIYVLTAAHLLSHLSKSILEAISISSYADIALLPLERCNIKNSGSDIPVLRIADNITSFDLHDTTCRVIGLCRELYEIDFLPGSISSMLNDEENHFSSSGNKVLYSKLDQKFARKTGRDWFRGMSGSPLINLESNKIVGLFSGGNIGSIPRFLCKDFDFTLLRFDAPESIRECVLQVEKMKR